MRTDRQELDRVSNHLEIQPHKLISLVQGLVAKSISYGDIAGMLLGLGYQLDYVWPLLTVEYYVHVAGIPRAKFHHAPTILWDKIPGTTELKIRTILTVLKDGNIARHKSKIIRQFSDLGVDVKLLLPIWAEVLYGFKVQNPDEALKQTL